MSHTLVTFLGRGRQNPQALNSWEYLRTRYKFPPPSVEPTEETALFGMALTKHIRPDLVVILGTSGSSWSALLMENLDSLMEKGLKQTEENLIEELLKAEKDQRVSEKMLDKAKGLMKRALNNIPVDPRLILFGEKKDDQYKILSTIADAVPEGTVSLDLTHGFRHLGMIGFLSAFMLESARGLEVCDLWYGAYDRTPQEGTKKGITPVLKLDGLNRVRHWINALERFDATGDYSVFVPLLITDGVPENEAKCLEHAAFYERTHRLSRATGKINTFLPELNKPLPGASGLFKDQLAKRLAWAKSGTLSIKQGKLAYQYLDRRDYVRATTFGWEALITLQCEKQGYDLEDPDKRTSAREEFRECLNTATQRDFDILNQIRNALAHGTSPTHGNCKIRTRCNEMLNDEQKLRKGLKKTFDCLLAPRAN